MKRVLLYVIAIIAGLFILAVVWSQYPTLGKQVQFNQSVWERSHKPLDRIRYYMSDSLVEKLKDEQPTIEEAVGLLGSRMARLKTRKWHSGINCFIIVTSNFESTFFGKGKSTDFRKVKSTP